MRCARVAFAVYLSFVLPTSLTNQQTAAATPPQRDPQALAILQGALAAMGGLNLAGIQDTRTTVQFRFGDPGASQTSSAVVTTSGNSSLRVDTDGPAGTSVFVLTDKDAVSYTPAGPVEQLPRTAFGNIPISHLPVFAVSTVLTSQAASLEYAGLEGLGDVKVHHVRVRFLPAGDLDQFCDFFIDAQTLLVVELDYLQRAPSDLNTTQLIQVSYKDYRATSGILVPFDVAYSADGNFISEQIVESFAVNLGTTSSSFSLE